MFRVTADTNIYVSALSFNGKPRRLLEAARLRLIQLAISDAILDELRRVLHDKFDWPSTAVDSAVERLMLFVQRVEPAITLRVIASDPDDDRVLECAVTAGSRFIISGDDDLLSLRVYEGIRIMTVASFLEFAQLPTA